MSHYKIWCFWSFFSIGASDAHEASALKGASDAHNASGAVVNAPSNAQDACGANDEISDVKEQRSKSKKARPRSSGGKPGTRTKKGKSHRSGL